MYHDLYVYRQTGKLTALGLSFCVEIIPELSAGITLNMWDDNLSKNNWTQQINRQMILTSSGKLLRQSTRTETFKMKGVNTSLGLLYETGCLNIGLVVKTPFTGSIDHAFEKNQRSKDYLKMPLSLGAGVAWMFSERFFVSADFYHTKWQDYVYITEDNKQICPITGYPVEESDIYPTNQIRMGTEYIFFITDYQIAVPVRAGVFYDPAPDIKHPDDFYGGSLGMGLSFSKFSLDLAYQFRFGKNVGKIMIQARDFSEDIYENTVYISCIYYLD